jgi:hypothetical protein
MIRITHWLPAKEKEFMVRTRDHILCDNGRAAYIKRKHGKDTEIVDNGDIVPKRFCSYAVFCQEPR